MTATTKQVNNLKQKYVEEVVPALQKELGLENPIAVPRIDKVIVNAGVGEHSKDDKFIQKVVDDITKITSQKPVKTLARKAISGFKIREGDVVGVKVTLRGDRMYDFLHKLIDTALPRVRDFRGISTKAFDGQGNYSIGIKDHTVFPEISADTIDYTFPLQIVISTTAQNQEEGYKLLKSLGFPFKKEEA